MPNIPTFRIKRVYLLSFLFLIAWIIIRSAYNANSVWIIGRPAGTDRAQTYREAMAWLSTHQRSQKKIQYISLGRGGGFASQFELVAASFVDAVANDTIALLYGHYQMYTISEKCAIWSIRRSNELQDASTCFFLPVTNASHQRPTQAHVAATSLPDINGNARLPQGLPVEVTPAIWWGIVQTYMFRLNPRMDRRVQEISTHMGLSRPPDIGVHIRLGDKLNDIASKQQRLQQLTTEQIVQTYIQEVQSAVETLRENRCRAVSWWQRLSNDCKRSSVVVYVASDSREALQMMLRWTKSGTAPSGITIVGRFTHTQEMSNRGTQIRVAMRDITNDDELYAIAEEIIYDMHILRQCRVIIGIIMSQVCRSTAAMAYATGRLEYAVAIDYENIQLHPHMPHWRHPKYTL